jgi:hypothetical protein
MEADEESAHRQVIFNSLEWYDMMKMKPVEECPETGNLRKEEQCKKDISFGVLNGKKDDKLILTTQYLIDNVLGAIS